MTGPFKKREGCRRSAYLTEEQEFMKPLPTRHMSRRFGLLIDGWT